MLIIRISCEIDCFDIYFKRNSSGRTRMYEYSPPNHCSSFGPYDKFCKKLFGNALTREVSCPALEIHLVSISAHSCIILYISFIEHDGRSPGIYHNARCRVTSLC